jgi:hypothetical protein
VIAAAAAGVAVVLLAGAWLLLGERETVKAGATPPEVAPTTELSWQPDPSDGSTPANPYPTVPPAQLRGNDMSAWMIRTDKAGRRLFVQVMETDCTTDEVRLRGEHQDRVEVEVRTVIKPVLSAPGGYACGGVFTADGPYAVLELSEPLGDRAVVVDRQS